MTNFKQIPSVIGAALIFKGIVIHGSLIALNSYIDGFKYIKIKKFSYFFLLEFILYLQKIEIENCNYSWGVILNGDLLIKNITANVTTCKLNIFLFSTL